MALKTTAALVFSVTIAATAVAQEQKEFPHPKKMYPAHTEFWEPQPKVVDPGNASTAPSDAIVLFDGSGLEEWTGKDGAAPGWRWEELAAVVAATAYLGWFLRAWLVFAPGLVLGGDLPAHHYLMDHIARTGRLVSWADGWWGGFPMFRYYFPLPYAAMAAFGKLAGHDLAFKLGSIAGVLALPLALAALG